MIYVFDGSNILGAERADEEARRALVSRAAQFTRSRRAKGILVFDGVAPAAFARSLGHLQVRFSGARSGDDLIVQTVRSARGPWTVVTRDRELQARVASRSVKLMDPDGLRVDEEGGGGDTQVDWEEWLSDPANRLE